MAAMHSLAHKLHGMCITVNYLTCPSCQLWCDKFQKTNT